MASVRIKAKYALLDADTLLENALVTLRDGQIAGVRRARPHECADVEASTLMPGLVNAHCHIELSCLAGRLRPVDSISTWLKRLVPKYDGVSDWRASARAGLARLAENGVTSVGDICMRHTVVLPVLRADPIRKVVYCEVIGPTAERERDSMRLARAARGAKHVTIGVTPHAPYTTTADAYRRCMKFGRPLATHVSETREEVEFLRDLDGPMIGLFKHFKAPYPFARAPARSPISYLDSLGVVRRGVALIHANYLTRRDRDVIRARGAGVVHCPGSHAFFGHDESPLGLPLVALGTDSLASNRDLSILREMRLVRRRVDAPTAFRMATENGARVLFGDARVGKIRPGWAADLTAVAVHGDPLEAVTLDEPRVDFALAAGRWVKRPA